MKSGGSTASSSTSAASRPRPSNGSNRIALRRVRRRAEVVPEMRLCLIVVLIATGARASSVTNEVIVNSTQTTDSNPRTGSIGDAMAGIIDLNDLFALDLGAM